MSAAVCVPSLHLGACLRPFARSASKSTTRATSRLPRPLPGQGEISHRFVSLVVEFVPGPSTSRGPLPRPGRCTCLRRFARRPRALPDVCGRLRSLFALCRMSAAVCSLSSHFAGCLRPFALRLRALVGVCGRLRMSAAVRSSWPQGVQLSLFQGLRGLPRAGRIQLQKRITGCQIRASNLNFQGSPLPRLGKNLPSALGCLPGWLSWLSSLIGVSHWGNEFTWFLTCSSERHMNLHGF